ncbi:MAG: UV DNA damage repair endonuclease UvsE [Candidatus Paceibacterota bacterium]
MANYSQEYLIEKISGNLDCLERILRWNTEHNLLFFRITSDLIPFGSHPVHDFDFATYFGDEFATLGEIISVSDMRISMHPGQYTLLNAEDGEVVGRAVADLQYHADVLDALGLDSRHKIQIHVGGVYGDKPAAKKRFISEYRKLPDRIKNRLVIENDDVSYSVADCLEIHEETGIPIIFDNLHHACLHESEDEKAALQGVAETWKREDGVPMTDYSDQEPGERKGKHRTHIDVDHFREFLRTISETGLDVDIMLEIKNKEKSALLAREALDE